MPRCLDQKTNYKLKDERDVLLKHPVFETELIMREEGEVKVFLLKTFVTKAHPRVDINEDESVREHYVTTITDKNSDRNPDYPVREDYDPYSNKRTIQDSEILGAIKIHLSTVNNIREYGSRKVMSWIYERS